MHLHARTLTAMLCSAGLTAAEPGPAARPLLHPLFSDEAVIQRERPVTVWGWSTSGAAVTVSLSGTGLDVKPVTAKAGDDGRWQVTIGPFPAGGPYVLRAESGGKKAEAKDVLIGDVWLCGGQSNMEMTVKNSKDFDTERAKADLPLIRHIQVKKNNADSPQLLFRGEWKACTPDTVGAFTAAGFYMARTLHADLKVPIGLVHSSWGGTTCEAWTSAQKIESLPDTDLTQSLAAWKKDVAATAEQKSLTGKDYTALIPAWYQDNDPGTAALPAWSAPECDDSAWSAFKLPGTLETIGAIPATWDGTVWIRRAIEIPASKAGKRATLRLGRIDDCDTAWVNGHKVGEMEAGFQRNYSIPADALRPGTNIIALRLLDLGGQCSIASPMTIAFDGDGDIQLAGDWRVRTGVELTKATTPLPARFDRVQGPSSLFNGMINPLVPMTMTGIIWYQGEANVWRAYQYRTLLPGMIADWRERFGQGDIPFLIVSLANHTRRSDPRSDSPPNSAWAELREAQAMTARRIAKGGLAVAIDIGEADNIHPKNKQEVGRRLALAAESIVYGKSLEWSGPWYSGMEVEDTSIRLRFDHLGGGLVASDGGALTGFAIAGEDKNFIWADATIDGDTVVVKSDRITRPVAVRYAWANNPVCNLANKAGLPAVPFRTDDWLGLTWPKPSTTTVH